MTNDLEMLQPLLKKEVCLEMDGRYLRGLLTNVSESYLCLKFVYLVNLDKDEDELLYPTQVFLLKSKVSLIVEVVRDDK